ncbi:small multi-drug export protein [Salinarchaeum sp. IM2453]|nr:small multi-drug export protein [Salinarchaeum sp. IM2453]
MRTSRVPKTVRCLFLPVIISAFLVPITSVPEISNNELHTIGIPLFTENGVVTDILQDYDGGVQYLLVAILAAIPWIEIALVIPAGIALGINPTAVAIFAFLGNVLSVYIVILFCSQVKSLWGSQSSDTDGSSEPSKRRQWANRLWDHYGLPGLALASVILTGVHVAALIALAIGSAKRAVAVWMTISIAIWTVGLTAATYYGIEGIQILLD